jgi:hypothetical protein
VTDPARAPAVRLVVQRATQTHIDDMVDLSRRAQTPRPTDLASMLVPLEHTGPNLPPRPVVPKRPIRTTTHHSRSTGASDTPNHLLSSELASLLHHRQQSHGYRLVPARNAFQPASNTSANSTAVKRPPRG